MTRVGFKSLLRSSSVAGIASFWQVASGIFLTPLVLASVGIEGFGVWALLHGISGSMNTVSGSLNLAYAKLTAEYGAEGRDRELSGLLGSGVLMIGAASALGLGIIWHWRMPVLRSLGVPQDTLVDAGLALGLVLLGLFARLSLGCFRQILAGLQRTDLQYQARILSSVTYFIVGLVVLEWGMGLPGLGIAFLSGELLASAIAWYWVRQHAPELRVRIQGASVDGMRRFLVLGSRFQALRFIHQGATYGIRMLMSALMGPAMLGTYELGRKLVRLGQTGSRAIMAPMMPAFAALHASRDEARTQLLYREGSRLLFVAGLLCFGFLGVFAERALVLWTGAAHPLAVWVIRVLAISCVIRPLTGMGTASLRGRGRVGLEARTALLALGLRLLILFPFFTSWGFQGFVITGPMTSVVGSAAFVLLYSWREHISVLDHLGGVVVRPLLVLVPVIALTAWASPHLAFEIEGLSVRWIALCELAVAGIVYALVSGAAVWFVLLRAEERAAVLDRLGRLSDGGPADAATAVTQ